MYSIGDVSVISEEDEDDDYSTHLKNPDDADLEEQATLQNEDTPMEHIQYSQSSDKCPGFVQVIDNIDLNVRRSDQIVNYSMQSFHFCHMYGLLNRVNSTVLQDEPPSGMLSSELILPSKIELDHILKDFIIFVER